MIKHGIERKLIEQKVTFMNGLRPEWMVVVSTVKTHEQFKSYSLAKLVGILKSHESVVTKEAKVISGVGSLALVSKGKSTAEEEEESDMSECDLTSEEYALMVTNPKKFPRRKFPVSKNRNWQESDSSEKMKDEPKTDEKREGEDDEAYYMRKLEEVKKKKASNSSMNALIVQENAREDEFGGVEVWSTESEDEEEDEVIVECESEVSSEETSSSYRLGLDKIETFIDSKEHKSMLKNILDENDRQKIKTETIQTFDLSNAKIVQDNKINLDNSSEFDVESEMSEILVDDEVDCSKFMKHETENEKHLISENSVEFARLSKEQKPKLKEKVVVYQKVQTVPNQVYAMTGVTQRQMAELRIIVDEDNAEGCEDYFWSAPIDNADETVGLSDKTTWRVKGRYIPDPINKPSSFDIPSSIGTKDVPEEPMVEPDVPIKKEEPKVQTKKSTESKMKGKTTATQKEKPKANFNIHKSQKELAEQKRLRNHRYATNLNERKKHWNSQNSNYEPLRKESMNKGKETLKENFSPNSYYSKSQNRKSCLGPEPTFGPRPGLGP
ncbi:uncharacterized protein LOC128132855 [Lactuca sativa]|uniref:uncharacterized protein LOC128132855 n=1 Tax=Lactuca sativa TaxID=4236 RepID=UPI0022AF04E0|nr:uncharacterized protein LOC128132855 [Lactuca sativa]